MPIEQSKSIQPSEIITELDLKGSDNIALNHADSVINSIAPTILPAEEKPPEQASLNVEANLIQLQNPDASKNAPQNDANQLEEMSDAELEALISSTSIEREGVNDLSSKTENNLEKIEETIEELVSELSNEITDLNNLQEEPIDAQVESPILENENANANDPDVQQEAQKSSGVAREVFSNLGSYNASEPPPADNAAMMSMRSPMGSRFSARISPNAHRHEPVSSFSHRGNYSSMQMQAFQSIEQAISSYNPRMARQPDYIRAFYDQILNERMQILNEGMQAGKPPEKITEEISSKAKEIKAAVATPNRHYEIQVPNEDKVIRYARIEEAGQKQHQENKIMRNGKEVELVVHFMDEEQQNELNESLDTMLTSLNKIMTDLHLKTEEKKEKQTITTPNQPLNIAEKTPESTTVNPIIMNEIVKLRTSILNEALLSDILDKAKEWDKKMLEQFIKQIEKEFIIVKDDRKKIIANDEIKSSQITHDNLIHSLVDQLSEQLVA